MILSSMAKKLLSMLVLFAILGQTLLVPKVALAQAPPAGAWWAPTPDQFNQKVNDPGIPASEIFGERYTQAQVYWIIYSIINFVTDPNVQACAAGASAAGGDAVAKLNSFKSCNIFSDSRNIGGMFALANVTGSFFYRPASGVRYLSYVAQKINLPVANAQQAGFGFNTALSPVLTVWAAARDAAYALMILAVIILAFMIMFRTRISPQASVTVQYAIPRILIGLILITFSYAIAGFIIDLSYVVQGIIAALVYQSSLINKNGWSIVDTFNQMNAVGTGILSYGLLIIAWAFVIGGGAGIIVGAITGGAGFVVFIIVAVIAIILFLIALFRTFWLMLRTYVMIIFHVIALPFAALGYVAAPGGNMFMSLLRSLIGNVSVFVTISVVVMFAHLIFWNMAGAQYSALSTGVVTGLFNPYRSQALNSFPTGGGGMPGFGEVDLTSIAIFIGLVILLMAPSVANNVKSLIISGRPSREGLGMVGAGFIGGVAGFAGAQIRQGGLGMAGVSMGNWGIRQQQLGRQRGGIVGGIQKSFGLAATNFGNQYAQPYSHRTTGAIREYRPKGTIEGTMHEENNP